jgi:hypothetical protein
MPTSAPLPSTSSATLKRSNYPFCGRLSVLQTGHTGIYDPFAGLSSLVQLNFPSMPEVIELARSAEYIVNQVITSPDGFHQYKATNPLSIPISFKLHAFDKEFCPNGALSLLQIAALLHSFTLPLSNSGGTTLSVTAQQADPAATPAGDLNSVQSRSATTDTGYNITPDSGSDFAPPVTLRLDLMAIDANTPGIVCIGYVKDVNAKLLGPFLRGPAQAYNLPTAGDFEFTFVHVPGYGNNFNITGNIPQQEATISQAYANTVRKQLYNTVSLSQTSSTGYTGFGS